MSNKIFCFTCPPILLVFFNRPEVLRQNLLSLARIKPRKLYLACDGPRSNRSDDHLHVMECRRIANELVKWDCDIETLYTEFNYGCDTWVPNAISWFFSKVDSGIVLEDDCIINEGFARFSAEMLEKYRGEHRVMNISASNFQQNIWGDGDYYFSAYPSNWGWASWARAWKKYDSDMVKISNFINSSEFSKFMPDKEQQRYWMRFYEGLRSQKYTFWDAKWLLSIWANQGISITPNMNLVTNIGFDKSATHTKNKTSEDDLMICNAPSLFKDPIGSYLVRNDADRYLFLRRYKPKFLAKLNAAYRRAVDSFFK